MATLRKRFGNTGSTAGGDGTTDALSGGNRAYASVAEAEAAEQANLVTADVFVEIHLSGTAADTGNCAIDGWTTDATRYLAFIGNPDNAAGRHPGYWSTSHYRLSVTDPAGSLGCFENYEAYVRWDGIQVEISRSSTGTRRCWYLETGLGLQIDNTLYQQNPSSSGSGSLIGVGIAGTLLLTMINSVGSGFVQGTGQGIINADAGGVVYTYNCGAYGCDIGFNNGSGTWTSKNSWAQACSDGFQGTFAAGTAKNISDIASDAPGTGSKQATIVFVNAAAGDFHLDITDTEAVTFGDDLSADSIRPFSTDIDGETRVDWSCGPDERVVVEITANGNAFIGDLVAAGTATVSSLANGSAAIPDFVVVGAGSVFTEAQASAFISDFVVTGAAENPVEANGTAYLPEFAPPESTGVVATGVAYIGDFVVEGETQNPAFANGASEIPEFTAAGVAGVGVAANGPAYIADFVAAGTATSAIDANGIAYIGEFEHPIRYGFPGEGGSRIAIRIGIGLGIAI
jgi:hypothetical protein